MDGSENSYHKYPVTFSLRVMGEDRDDFAGLVYSIVSGQVEGLQAGDLNSRPSRAGKYVSITVTFTAESKAQLDSIYRELSANERVLMVL